MVRLAAVALLLALAPSCAASGPLPAHDPGARTVDPSSPPTAALPAATTAPVSSADPGRPTSEPYTGDLSIFEEPGRDQALQIERVMDVLGVAPGAVVADVGAGSGWLTVRAARRVGAGGAVHAVEINQSYLDHIAARARREQLSNVRLVLGKTDDPLLAPQSVDVVVLLKTYHELEKPVSMARRLLDALRPGGTLGVIDRNGRGDDHGVDAEIVVREVASVGFSFEAKHDFVRSERVDYLLVFRKPRR